MSPKTMTLDEHVAKCVLILDNTERLYAREQAIFRVYNKSGDYWTDFHDRLP